MNDLIVRTDSGELPKVGCEWCGAVPKVASAIKYGMGTSAIVGARVDPRHDVLRAPMLCDDCISLGVLLRKLYAILIGTDGSGLADLTLLLANVRAQREQIEAGFVAAGGLPV